MLQPVASPTPPFGLSACKPYSDISDMLMPASQPPVPADGDGRKVGEFEETRSWSFEACHVFLEFLVGWRSFVAGIDVQERKAVKGHEQKHMLLDFLFGPSGFFESLREPDFLHIYCHCFFSLGVGNIIFMSKSQLAVSSFRWNEVNVSHSKCICFP